MAIFMSEGLAEVISLPHDISFGWNEVLRCKIVERDGRLQVSVRIADKHVAKEVVHMPGKIAKIGTVDDVLSMRIFSATFKSKTSTLDIKGSVINT